MSCIINLFDQVIMGETGGGQVEFLFYDANQDGIADSGGTAIQIDSSGGVNFDGAIPGDYYFRHWGGVEPCDGELTFFIRVGEGADAGTGMTVDLCNDADPINVFSLISGTPDDNGAWSGSGTTSPGWISNVDPTLVEFDPTLVPLGVYEFTYTVAPVPPAGYTMADCPNCVPVSTTVTINVISCNEPPPPCGNVGESASVSICSSSGCAFDLINQLGGSPDSGGQWLQLSGPAVIVPSGDEGTVNFGGAPVGVYQFTYSFSGVDPDCTQQSVVTVQVVSQPWAGTNGTANLCESAGNTNLFPYLGGNPNVGGSWNISPVLPNGTFGSNGFINPQAGDAGTYTATYTVSNPVSGPCGTVCIDTATVTIVITANCNANNGSATRCLQGGTLTLDATVLMPGSTGGGTWGVAGRSANCNNQYGPPAVFSINGAPAANHFGQTLASGVVLSNFASLGCYLFIYTCTTANPNCNDQSQFVLQIIDCPAPCNSTVTIQATNCAMTILSLTNCPSPIYQWQVFQSGTWVAAPGDNDNNNYTGLNNLMYRLRVTGCPNCGTIYSNVLTLSCPPAPTCNITCALTYNATLQRLQAVITNTGAVGGSVGYQFNKYTTNNANCLLCGGAMIAQCSGTVVVPPMGSVQVNCNVAQTSVEQCWRFVTLGGGPCNQTLCCTKIPAAAAFCWELPTLAPFTDITQITVNAGAGNINILTSGNNFNCTEYESTDPNGTMNGNINCSLAQAVIDINNWLSAAGHLGTCYIIQKAKSSSLRVSNTNITFVSVTSVSFGVINFAASGCTACDGVSWHFQGLDTVNNFSTTVGVGGYLNPNVAGTINLFTLLDQYFGGAPVELPHNGTFTAAICTVPTSGCVDINTNCWSDCSPPPPTPVTVVNNIGFADHGNLNWIVFTPINSLCHWQIRYLVTLPNGCQECVIITVNFNSAI